MAIFCLVHDRHDRVAELGGALVLDIDRMRQAGSGKRLDGEEHIVRIVHVVVRVEELLCHLEGVHLRARSFCLDLAEERSDLKPRLRLVHIGIL